MIRSSVQIAVVNAVWTACLCAHAQTQVYTRTQMYPSVQEAINSLPTAGGTLHFAAGDYVLPGTVTIDRPIVFQCDPGVWFSLPKLGFMFRVQANDVRFLGAGFRCAKSGHCVQVIARDTPKEAARQHRDWLFRDCVFDGTCLYVERVGRYTHDGKQQDTGADIAGDVTIDRCTFRNAKTPAAITLAGVDRCTIRDCLILDCGIDGDNGDGIKVTAGSQHILITGTRIERVTRDGIDLFDACRTTISDCVIRDCGAHGVDAKTSTSTHNPTNYHALSNCLVERCAITGYSLDVDDVTCSSCTAIECQDGFRNVAIDGGKVRVQRGIFVGNRAVRCKRNGFYFGGQDTTRAGNQATDCATSFLITAINSEIGSVP